MLSKKSKALSVCLAVLLLFSILPLQGFAAPVEPFRVCREFLKTQPNAENKLFVYDALAEGLGKRQDVFDVSDGVHALSPDDAHMVYQCVYADYPEYFWTINGGYSYYIGPNNTMSRIIPSYTFTAADLPAAQAQLQAVVNNATYDLQGKSDYEKSKTLMERIAMMTGYKLEGLHQTSYGALVDKIAVCAGYAQAYALCLRAVGVPACTVTGYAHGNPQAGHAWSLVQLDGDWYWSDPTWADPTRQDGGSDDSTAFDVSYRYLNLTFAQISRDHTLDEPFSAFAPHSTATANSYEVHARKAPSYPYSVQEVGRLFAENDLDVTFYVPGRQQEFTDWFNANYWGICAAANIGGGSLYPPRTEGDNVVIKLIDSKAGAKIVLGDLNGDGLRKFADYAMAINCTLGIQTTDGLLDRGDVNGDRAIDAFDAAQIEQALAGLIPLDTRTTVEIYQSVDGKSPLIEIPKLEYFPAA